MATELSLKLLVDTTSRRVLFAEAGKDVIDFLFSLLSMPVGSIIKLLTKERMVGSIGSIYKSIENLDETYLESNQYKTVLLNPTTATKNTLFLTGPTSTTSSATGKYYRCNSSCKSYYTDASGTRCPDCSCQMTLALYYVSPKSGKIVAKEEGEGCKVGFVKGVVTYTVMDDLTVVPMSTISSITLLNKFNVRDVACLEEHMVKLGMKEGLELLKASLRSKTVLTDVFLGRKAARRG